MTAPMLQPTGGFQGVARRRPRPTAPGDTTAPGAPLSLASSPTTVPYGATTPSVGAGNYESQTITPGPAVDRIGLAGQAFDTFAKSTEPYYQRDLRTATQHAAGTGNIGSGPLRSSLGDVNDSHRLELDTARSNLLNQAVTGSIEDSYRNIGIAQQQQDYQASRSDATYAQALATAQQNLAKELGRGQLSLANRSQSEGTALAGGSLTGNYGGTPTLAAKEQAFSQPLALASVTGSLNGTPTLGARSLDLSAELGRGGLDVSRGQLGLASRGQSLAETLGLGGLSLEQQRAALDEKVRTGELTIAQRGQALAELSNTQQYGLAGRAQSLAETTGMGGLDVARTNAATSRAAQQSEATARTGQLGLATRAQTLSETLGLAGLSLEQQKFALDHMVQTGQLSIAQRNQALSELQNSQQFGLASNAQQIQQQQFGQSQAQSLDLARMGDTTANRGIDANLELARQEMLFRGALAGASGGTGGTSGTGGTGGGGGITMPGAGPPWSNDPAGGAPHGGLMDQISYGGATSYGGSPTPPKPIYQNGQWWDSNTGWSMDGRNFSSAIASIADVRGQPMLQGGQPFEAPQPLRLAGNPLYEANPGVPHELLDDSYTGRQGWEKWTAEQAAGQARGNYGRAPALSVDDLYEQLQLAEDPAERQRIRAQIQDLSSGAA